MPIIKQQGLRGLRGLGELSEGERKKFYADNAAVLSKYSNNPMHYGIAAERLYNNQKFINAFGEDAFDQLNDGTKAFYDYRNKLFRDKTIENAFVNKYGKESNFKTMYSQLDTDGMYDLLTNEEYLGESERKKIYNKTLNAAKKVGKSYDAAINNPYVDAIGAGFMQWGKTESALRPSINEADYAKKDKEILDKLYADTQKRREADIQDAADIMYANMLDNDDSGKKSLAQYYKEFDKFATKNSSFYNTFKNSRWMKDYTNEDRLKDYAKYLALKQKYGEGIALQYFERSMQNKIADAQDGAWTGNTLKGVLTTAWSDLGSNVALFANVGKSAEQMAILNQGKDPKKPIYDKKGNIIDYQRNDDWVTNPAYWNNVYKYNTFSPTEIKAIEERGGISEDVNVREFGYTPDFFSWDTVEEGFKQGGHVIAGIVETGLTGAAGRMVGWAGKGAMKAMGLSAKAMQSASKAGRIANNFIVGATTGLEGSQLEAMGTFDEQLQTNKEKIQKQITKELYDYQRTINYNSNAAKLGINNIYRQLKAQDNKRVSMGNREGSRAFPLSDEILKAQAKQLYTNQLLSRKQKELEEFHKKDELQAARDAQKAYTTNFIMGYVKNIPLTLGIQKFKIAKGSIRNEFDNIVKKNVVADAETGGVKRGIEKTITKDGKTEKIVKDMRYSSGKRLGMEIAKQLTGGFMDEYMDGLNASFASGIGNNEFDNYIKRNYDPKAYNSTVDSFLGCMLAGMSEGIDGITDRQNLYEGFIGMISPVATATVNPNAAFRPKDTWKAVVKGTDAYGNKLGKIDRLSNILMNPLLNSITDAREKDRNLDNAVEAINTVVAANKNKLQDAAKIISVLDNYNGTLNTDRGLLDSKDNKLLNAFTLLSTLNTLENMDGGTGAKLYKDTMETMEGLANGTLKKEQLDHEVDRFLADENNKSILDQGEEGRKIAADRLKANAKYFMDMRNKLSDIQDTFAHSPNMKEVSPEVQAILAYNIVASDDYKKRLQNLEEELGLGNTDTDSLYNPDYNIRYYTLASRNKAVLARDREIEKTQKEIDKLKEEHSKLKEKIESLKAERKAITDDDRKVTMKTLIENKKKQLKSKEFELKSVEDVKKKLIKEKEEISKLTDAPAFDESSILNADARDRAYILDPKNRSNYSQGVQAIIDNVSNNLKQKDPEALVKIQDAATLASRLEDMRTIYNKVLDNSELTDEYLTTVGAARDKAAMAESLQSDIYKYYNTLGKAYEDREQYPQAFKNYILQRSPELIEAYMEDYPNQANAIQPYYDMLKFDRDAEAVIARSGYTEEERKMMVNTISGFHNKANNRQELEKMIEGLIDSPDVDETIKGRFEHLMSKLSEIGYQRDATILEKRAERKKREEEEKKKQEEAQKKAEEEAKVAAEKKTEEDKVKANQKDSDTINEALDEKEISKAASSNTEINTSMGDDDYKNVETEDVATINFEESSEGPNDNTEKASDTKNKAEEKTDNKENEVLQIKYNQVMQVSPEEYESIPETAKHEENATFEAHSAEKDGDNWYFIGNFAGSKEQTKVKAKKGLDIEQLGEQQSEEGKIATENAMPSNIEIVNGTIEGRTPSLEEQVNDMDNTSKEVHLSDAHEDASTLNGTGQNSIDTNPITLSGNGMSRYEPGALENDGRIVLKKGEKEDDNMSKYYAWMDAAGIKLQNIIDNEVARIIKRNPHAKVRFMGVKPEDNATNDMDMFKHCMLVLDYDDSINKGITSIHDDKNGGVIESLGKKYLIIGVAGYPRTSKYKQGLWNILWDSRTKDGLRLTVDRKKFFSEHPTERFYVNTQYSTEIVPYSQIPGYIVKQMVGEGVPEARSVSELLADKKRNPQGFTMETAAWGIQELSKFLIVNASPENVMIPRDSYRNMGSAFVLMPASNGKLVPSYLRVLKYTEMNDGKLKNEIDNLLFTVVGPNYDNAKDAIKELLKIFYLNKEGDNILRSQREVSLVHDGQIVNTFVLNDEFDRQQFIKAVEKLNPRINITARVLGNQELLHKYDEAGALMTDAALFGTAGSSYSIYALDKSGKMMMPETPVNVPKAKDGFKNTKSQVIYDHQYYTEEQGVFSLDGKTITDEKLIQQLQYNKRIIDSELTPSASKDTLDYFILGTGEHPEVISIDRNTKEVKILNEQKAKELIDKINEQQDKIRREKNAEKMLKEMESQTPTELEDVEGIGDDFEVDEETGEIIPKNNTQIKESPDVSDVKDTSVIETANHGDNSLSDKSIENLSNKEQKSPTQKFTTLMKDRKHKMKIIKLISSKWSEAPKKISDMEKFLRDKNIEVDAIGTSKEDIDAWIRTIEDCR